MLREKTELPIAALPQKERRRGVEIFVDFDGTISRPDTLDLLLNRLAPPWWVEIEELVRRGELPEAWSLPMEFSLIGCSMEEALSILDSEVTIDPHFIPFIRWCGDEGIPVTVLSGGAAPFIDFLFRKFGVPDVPFISNDVEVEGERWRVIPASVQRLCDRCNHCKASSVVNARGSGALTVYIGDGLTDRCAASLAHVIMAKDGLERFCIEGGIPHIKYDDFSQVRRELGALLEDPSAPPLSRGSRILPAPTK